MAATIDKIPVTFHSHKIPVTLHTHKIPVTFHTHTIPVMFHTHRIPVTPPTGGTWISSKSIDIPLVAQGESKMLPSALVGWR